MQYVGCGTDECFAGNVKTDADLSHLQGLKYRLGDQALNIYGDKIDPERMRPLFIHEDSLARYNSIM